MNQNLWGPKYWFTLHTVSFEYPMKPTFKEKKIYYNFFNSLQYILPCSICKRHFKKNLKELPLENSIHSRRDLVYWLIDIHNKVNVETGKRIYSYEEVINIYEKLLNKKIELGKENKNNIFIKKNNKSKIVIIILLIVMIILVIIILLKKKCYLSIK
tara:strand:- start:2095 stop:2565 length:471 start_codon:yes stop_codon:yes gene_type:complete